MLLGIDVIDLLLLVGNVPESRFAGGRKESLAPLLAALSHAFCTFIFADVVLTSTNGCFLTFIHQKELI